MIEKFCLHLHNGWFWFYHVQPRYWIISIQFSFNYTWLLLLESASMFFLVHNCAFYLLIHLYYLFTTFYFLAIRVSPQYLKWIIYFTILLLSYTIYLYLLYIIWQRFIKRTLLVHMKAPYSFTLPLPLYLLLYYSYKSVSI